MPPKKSPAPPAAAGTPPVRKPAASPDQATAAMVAALPEKTGRAIAEWLQLLEPMRGAKHGEIVAWLKAEHGVTHGYANLIAQEARGGAISAPPAGDDLVDAMFGGAKAALRPAYEKLVAAVGAFGGDVEVAPKKTYVSLRRSKQFALVQPSTATRLDVGINLKGVAASGRLEASGSFNAMVSHRVRVASAGEVDDELLAWLRAAYDAA